MSKIINMNAMRMTSQEIADLVEKRHDNVKRTIETLVNQGVIVHPQIEDIPGADSMGRPRATQVYVFSDEQGKRDSIVVVAQLSPEFTARLVDRWQELEKQLERRDPMEMLNDPAVLRQTLLGYSEKVLALEATVQEQAPKVAVHDRLLEATGLLTLREVATTIGYPERKMIQWMQRHDWLYRRPGRGTLLGYADRIKAGHLEHKVMLILNERTGQEETRESVRVTPKGLALLTKALSAESRQLPVAPGLVARPTTPMGGIRH